MRVSAGAEAPGGSAAGGEPPEPGAAPDPRDPGGDRDSILLPYVSKLALRQALDTERATVVDGTLAFVDISGFTRLTELLSSRGKAGAEELTDVLNGIFAKLVGVAYAHAGELVKWGGDAILVLFAGPGHAGRAVDAAFEMQQRMRRIGRLRTSVGSCTLQMSVGVHSGRFHFLTVGTRHLELVVTGPAATITATMEAVAEAGEIVASADTATMVPSWVVGPPKGPGYLIAAAPRLEPVRAGGPGFEPPGLPGRCLPEKIREHLVAAPVESEHRQVAVAFVEFGGTDALLASGGDAAVAAALHELVGRIQESCAVHDVAFWETDIATDGGKIMLVAGAPSATGDDTGRLLVVVRDAIDGGGPLRLRAGVNHGRVFAGDFGPAYRRTYSVKGDAVNLAARLMARAGRGEIYVSDAALRRSRTPFAAEALEPFLVKGKAAPVQAHRLGPPLGARRSPRPDSRAPLVGRDAEMQLLDERLRASAAGHGGCVGIEGAAGIGKSRILDEVAARAAGHRALVVTCDGYQSAVPYAPLRTLGRQCLGIDTDATPALAGPALSELVRERRPDLIPWLPLIARVIDADVAPTRESSALDERFRRARLEEAFLDLLRAVLQGPTLLVADDAQHMDDASVSLLRRVAVAAGSLPWLVLVGRRPSGGGFTFSDDPGVIRLELGPLGTDAVSVLLHAVTEERPLPPHRKSALADRSGGNPLFLLELAASLEAGGEASLPDSIEDVIAAQIDRLAPADRRLLRVASVLGTQVAAPVVAAMVEDPDAPARLGALGEFLLEQAPNSFRFRHTMLRDTAYEGLPYARRRELHARAGEVLESHAGERVNEIAGLLAVHFGTAGRHREAWRYSRVAAERAWSLYASVEAAAFFEQALAAGRALGDTPPVELLGVAEALGDARRRLGEFDGAVDSYRLARRWAVAPVDKARLHYKVALGAERTARYTRALRMLSLAERTLGTDPGAPAARLRAEIRDLYGRVRHRQGRQRDSVALLRDAVEIARHAGASDVLASTLVHLDDSELALGVPGDGDHARLALEILRDLGDQPWLEAQALNQLGIRAYFAGGWSEAVAYYADSRAACERAGDQWIAAVESGNIAEVLSDQGHWVEAEAALQEALRTYRAARTRSFVAYGTLLLGRLAARRGEHQRARSLLESARTMYATDGEAFGVVHSDAVLAESHLLAGDAAAARRLAERVLAGASRLAGGDLLVPSGLRVLALAGAALGADPASVRGHLERSVEVARARGYRYEVAMSVQAMIDLLPGEVDAGLLDESDALFEQLGVTPAARRLAVGFVPDRA